MGPGVPALPSAQRSVHPTPAETRHAFRNSEADRVRVFVIGLRRRAGGERVTEDHPTNPVSPYGITKLAAEQLCSVYAKQGRLDVITLRLFTVYGPRQRPDMAFHRRSCSRPRGYFQCRRRRKGYHESGHRVGGRNLGPPHRCRTPGATIRRCPEHRRRSFQKPRNPRLLPAHQFARRTAMPDRIHGRKGARRHLRLVGWTPFS